MASPEHPAAPPAPKRQYVNFVFYQVDPAWRRLPEDVRTQGKQELLRAVEDYTGKVLVVPYSTVGIRGARAVQPRPVVGPEVPEPARVRVERLLQVGEGLHGGRRHGRPTELARLEEVDAQGPRDVVGAGPVGRIGDRPTRVLVDPVPPGEPFEVRSNGRRQGSLSHGR